MSSIALESFRNRVFTSTQGVHFSFLDPYGHMNASRYLEFILNHRIEAVERQLNCSTMEIAKSLRIGFVIFNVNLKFLSPSFLGETLEIGSWVSDLARDGFTISTLVRNPKKQTINVAGKIEFKSVRISDGKLTALPDMLPLTSSENLIHTLPLSSDYLLPLKDIPGGVL